MPAIAAAVKYSLSLLPRSEILRIANVVGSPGVLPACLFATVIRLGIWAISLVVVYFLLQVHHFSGLLFLLADVPLDGAPRLVVVYLVLFYVCLSWIHSVVIPRPSQVSSGDSETVFLVVQIPVSFPDRTHSNVFASVFSFAVYFF